MRFWFVHSSDVSLQDQMVTQISLGILTGELAPGERLPSVRELARRFRLHPNTIALAYRRLQTEGWVHARRGSGMYVRGRGNASGTPNPQEYLRSLISGVLEASAALGVDRAELRAMLLAAADAKPPENRFVLVEPEPELLEILVAELEESLHVRIASCGFPCAEAIGDGIALVLPSKAERVRAGVPPGTRIEVLKVSSVTESLAGFLPAPKTALVAVVSAWPRFLELGRTMLVAAGFDPDALVIRNAKEMAGLRVDAVVCDLLTARMVPKGVRTIVFRVVAEESLEHVRSLYARPVSIET
jgi:DNA-binding transcriptional regulator YhcF (GntR family)